MRVSGVRARGGAALAIGVGSVLVGVAALTVIVALAVGAGGSIVNALWPGLIPGVELQGTWTYIVPRGYVGPLVIRYRCPGGHPFAPGGRIVTRFSARGVDCVRDDFPGWHGDEVAHRSEGTPMTVASGPDELPRAGDVLLSGGIETIGGRTAENPGKDDFVFSAYYAGPAPCAAGVLNGTPTPARCHILNGAVFAGRAFGYMFCPDDGTATQVDACLRAIERRRSKRGLR